MLSRERAIEILERESFDVVVIGGGITGVGVALDAASRGLSVALVERDDFASGTSSRSSKLIHGGLRYLRRLDLQLVREALLERRLLVELAPHLVRPLPFVAPCFDGERLDPMLGIGLTLYDAMAKPPVLGRAMRRAARQTRGDGARLASWHPPRHRKLSATESTELLGGACPRSPTGGYLFYDCQTDDARLVLTVLSEAERFGAVAANRLEVVQVHGREARHPGVVVRDGESRRELLIRAASIVNATGVWADRVGGRTDPANGRLPRIVPSRGSHVVVDHAALPLKAGVIIPAPGGRGIFALPWLGRTLIGTTDTDYAGTLEHVKPAAEDIAYLLNAVNGFLGTGLTVEQMTGAYAGVRPLIAVGKQAKTVDISRRAQLYESSGGMITITGGKLTTWRRMAKLVVDRIVTRDGRQAPCRTHAIPLGATIASTVTEPVGALSAETVQALNMRYGDNAQYVVEIASSSAELATPILPTAPDLFAEVDFAVRHEQARTVGDVLFRRTRLGLLEARRLCAEGCEVPQRIASVMGRRLGWDRSRIAAEVQGFRAEAESEGVAVAAEGAVA